MPSIKTLKPWSYKQITILVNLGIIMRRFSANPKSLQKLLLAVFIFYFLSFISNYVLDWQKQNENQRPWRTPPRKGGNESFSNEEIVKCSSCRSHPGLLTVGNSHTRNSPAWRSLSCIYRAWQIPRIDILTCLQTKTKGSWSHRLEVMQGSSVVSLYFDHDAQEV